MFGLLENMVNEVYNIYLNPHNKRSVFFDKLLVFYLYNSKISSVYTYSEILSHLNKCEMYVIIILRVLLDRVKSLTNTSCYVLLLKMVRLG